MVQGRGCRDLAGAGRRRGSRQRARHALGTHRGEGPGPEIGGRQLRGPRIG